MGILGRFYFKQTVNGNLIGEYSNQKSEEVWSESANKKPDEKNEVAKDNEKNEPFIGTYISTWGERSEAILCDLKISPKSNTRGIYSLTWEKDNSQIFKGEGFIVDNMLIGDYQD
jgi:hypothetical protein